MPNSKLLLLVVVVLLLFAALFVAGAAVGPRSTRPGQPPAIVPDLNAPWVQRLRARLTAPLPSDDVRLAGGSDRGCLVGDQQLQMPAGATCTFTLLASGSARQLRLQLAYGRSATATLAQPDALTIDNIQLAPNQPPQTYDVFASPENGRLTLTNCQTPEDAPLPLCLISL
ncbi:MAG: hypothetical protein KC425_13175, partial [Anaerolineales bacterium]|nr:hypothetical protein [Anaerolineales bacterium]